MHRSGFVIPTISWSTEKSCSSWPKRADWKELAAATCPDESVAETNEKPAWVEPAVVARVKYSGWTQEKCLRHPVFIGLREDVKPEDCKWESEVAAGPAAVVRAPEVVGRVISGTAQIEQEWVNGRAETITIELDGKRLRF